MARIGRRKRLPRGIRNNNPGNIEDGKFARSQPGYQDRQDSRFAGFDSPQSGLNAMAGLLGRYQQAKNLMTPAAMINRYAPPAENLTHSYANQVSQNMGIGPQSAFDMTQDPAKAARMMQGMVSVENGMNPYGIESYEKAVNNAIGFAPTEHEYSSVPSQNQIGVMSPPGLTAPNPAMTQRMSAAPQGQIPGSVAAPMSSGFQPGAAPMGFGPPSAAPSAFDPSISPTPGTEKIAAEALKGMVETDPTVGLRARALGMGLDPAAVGNISPDPSAIRSMIDTAHAAAPGPNVNGTYGALAGLSPSPTVNSVQTQSMPGLTDAQIGMGPPSAPSFGAPPSATPAEQMAAKAALTAGLGQPQTTVSAPQTTMGPTQATAPEAQKSAFDPFGPQSMPGMAPMSGVPTMPGTVSPLTNAMIGPAPTVNAPETQAPQQAVGQAPTAPPSMMGPPPAMAAPMTAQMSAPQLTPTVSPQTTPAQAPGQTTGGQQGSVSAPERSITAGAHSAGDFARAMAKQVSAKKAAVNSAGPEGKMSSKKADSGSKSGGNGSGGGTGGGSSSGGSRGGGSMGRGSTKGSKGRSVGSRNKAR